MTRTISCWIFLVIISLHLVLSANIVKRQAAEEPAELNPINEALLREHSGSLEHDGRGDREKRLGIIKSIGVKAILLNLIFGKVDSFIDAKTNLIKQLERQNVIKNEKYFGFLPPPQPVGTQRPQGSRPQRPQVSTEAPLEFSTGAAVSLVIPDRLYGSSFGLVTNISETIGDVLFNTAGRAQEFADRISRKLRRSFGFATNLLITNGPEKPASDKS